jgi:hypothetical protein
MAGNFELFLDAVCSLPWHVDLLLRTRQSHLIEGCLSLICVNIQLTDLAMVDGTTLGREGRTRD